MAQKGSATLVVVKRPGRIRRAAGKVGRGIMWAQEKTGFSYVLYGAVIFWIFNWLWEEWEAARENWYYIPIAFILIGFLLRTRYPAWSTAFLVVGGALFVRGWQANKEGASKAPKPGEAKGPVYLELRPDGSFALPEARGPVTLDDYGVAQTIADRVMRYGNAA